MGVVRVAFIPDGALRTYLRLMRSNILRGFQLYRAPILYELDVVIFQSLRRILALHGQSDPLFVDAEMSFKSFDQRRLCVFRALYVTP